MKLMSFSEEKSFLPITMRVEISNRCMSRKMALFIACGGMKLPTLKGWTKAPTTNDKYKNGLLNATLIKPSQSPLLSGAHLGGYFPEGERMSVPSYTTTFDSIRQNWICAWKGGNLNLSAGNK